MSTSPDSVSYTQSIAELLAPAVAPDWSNTNRPDEPWMGLFGVARETFLWEYYNGSAWWHPLILENTSTQTMSGTLSVPNATITRQLQLSGRTWSGTSILGNANLYENSTWSGTSGASNTSVYLKIFQTSENITAGVSGAVDPLFIHNTTTAGFTGGRHGTTITQDVTGAPGSFSGDVSIAALNTKTNVTASFGGTTPDEFGSLGSIFGMNPVAHLGPLATNMQALVGAEVDTWAQTGATYLDRIGLQVVDIGSSGAGARPTRDDYAFSVNNQYVPSSALGFKYAYGVGRYGGQFPLLSTGTMFHAQGNRGADVLVDYGFDLRLATTTKAAFAFKSASLDDSGNLQLGVAWLQPAAAGLTIDPTGSVGASAVVAAGGTLYPAVPIYLTDPYGGVWSGGTPVAGVISAVSMIKAPYVIGATPANPVALTGPDGYAGSGCTINITWTTGTTTTLNGKVAMGSGGPTITTGSAAASGTQPKGSIYLRTGGGVGTTLYVSQGAGTWNAVAGV